MANRSARPSSDLQLLDLDQFESLQDAVDKIQATQIYVDAASDVVPVAKWLRVSYPYLFWLSVLARANGLHVAIAREAQGSNGHAVFPLLRSYVETLVMLLYLHENPSYAEVIGTHPEDRRGPNRPKAKTMKALIAAVRDEAPGLSAVYAELSEATHFGAFAMWASHWPEETDDGSRLLRWTSEPIWRNEQQGLIACAQLLELAEAMAHHLRRFADRHLLPAAKQAARASLTEDP